MSSPNPPSGSQHNDSAEVAALLAFVRQAGKITSLAAGKALFLEATPCRGAYLIEEGEVELTIDSGERQMPLGTAFAGQLLGLAAVIRNTQHECTATARKDSRIIFVEAEAMRRYLRQHPESCLQTVQILGSEILDLSSNTIRPLRLQPRYPKHPDKS